MYASYSVLPYAYDTYNNDIDIYNAEYEPLSYSDIDSSDNGWRGFERIGRLTPLSKAVSSNSDINQRTLLYLLKLIKDKGNNSGVNTWQYEPGHATTYLGQRQCIQPHYIKQSQTYCRQ